VIFKIAGAYLQNCREKTLLTVMFTVDSRWAQI
jgi:hypothetical protein